MVDIGPWKPFLSALALPPVPMLVLALVGARVAAGRRRGMGVTLVTLAVALLWLSCCLGTAAWLQAHVIEPPAPLSADELARLGRAGASRKPTATIVVLGAGRRAGAAEFGGQPDLYPATLMRLRYGAWLARRTGLPLAYTGGVGWAQEGGTSEASVAARVSREELGMPLKWQESESRDTRENAILSMPFLEAAGTQEVVLVTDAMHMPRALRAFRQAAVQRGLSLQVTPAPINFIVADDRPALAWLPSGQGFRGVNEAAHEWLGLLAGK